MIGEGRIRRAYTLYRTTNVDETEHRPTLPVAAVLANTATPPPIRPPLTGANAPTPAELGAVKALGESRGIDTNAYATKLYGVAVAYLDRRQMSGVIDAL